MIEAIHVDDDTRAYLVKTCNGKYYPIYRDEERIDYYKYPIKQYSLRKGKGNDTLKEHKLLTHMKPGDCIVMSGYRHKKAMLGRLERPAPHLTVQWFKEIDISRMPTLYPYLYRCQTIVEITPILSTLIRYFYYFYFYQERYHLAIHVNQQTPIDLKSILGLEKLVLQQSNGLPLAIKVQLESPGIIEFISEHKDVIQSVLQLIIVLIQFKMKRDVKREYEELFQHYLTYKIEDLDLSLDDCKKNTKSH